MRDRILFIDSSRVIIFGLSRNHIPYYIIHSFEVRTLFYANSGRILNSRNQRLIYFFHRHHNAIRWTEPLNLMHKSHELSAWVKSIVLANINARNEYRPVQNRITTTLIWCAFFFWELDLGVLDIAHRCHIPHLRNVPELGQNEKCMQRNEHGNNLTWMATAQLADAIRCRCSEQKQLDSQSHVPLFAFRMIFPFLFRMRFVRHTCIQRNHIM